MTKLITNPKAKKPVPTSFPKIRKPYDPSIPVRETFSNATPTKQSFKDQCDINKIMKQYEKTGVIAHASKAIGSYGDFSKVEDYHASVNKVMAANEAFLALPSEIRKRFANEPANLLEFMADEANEAEAIELGLIPSKPSDGDMLRAEVPTEQSHEVKTPGIAPTDSTEHQAKVRETPLRENAEA